MAHELPSRSPMRLKTTAPGTLLAALAFAACSGPLTPSTGLSSIYSLSSIDGVPLPAPTADLPEGFVFESGLLDFTGMRPRPQIGIVDYVQVIRGPDGIANESRAQLEYTVEGNRLIINLCPPLALCLVATELGGPVDAEALTLTHMLAGQPRSVYHFLAQLPD